MHRATIHTMYEELGRAIGHALNVIVGVAVLAAALLIAGIVLGDLLHNGRFSVRTTLLFIGILPPAIGAAYFVIPWTWLLLALAAVLAVAIATFRMRKNTLPTT